MKFMIFFNGKEYFSEPVSQGVHPDTVSERYPGCMLLDFASSPEDAKSKIEGDRDRHKVVWY
jgi:hypothetical protein